MTTGRLHTSSPAIEPPTDPLTDPVADPLADSGTDPATAILPVARPLTEPRNGVPPVVVGERELAAAARAIAAGAGPVGIDAERASGHRYGQRAYLVQLRREGSGTWLFDPVACPDLSPVADAIGDAEWILHAATQDLTCLAEVGLRPHALFDTELGGRLAGLPRVGLGAMVEHYLGLALAKEHSAVDWSVRPLPESWLRYAALDVDVLGELRDAVADDLERQGKSGWAAEEFTHLLGFEGPEPRVDPWRRTSGMHRVRTKRGAAIVRELWEWRDQTAMARDVAPGRIVADAALSDLAVASQRATAPPRKLSSPDPRLLRGIRRHHDELLAAIRRAFDIDDDMLPAPSVPPTGPPPPKAWAERDPVAAARLTRSRELLGSVSAELVVPVENLLTPDLLRRYLWDGPDSPTTDEVTGSLAAMGARAWQTTIAAPLIALACAEHPLAS